MSRRKKPNVVRVKITYIDEDALVEELAHLFIYLVNGDSLIPNPKAKELTRKVENFLNYSFE